MTGHRSCTALKRDGSFCDSPSTPFAPFPICARHLTDAHLFVMEFGQMMHDKERSERAERRDAAMAAQSQVYYVRERDGMVKIGHSRNLRERLTALRLPPSAVLATEPGGQPLERIRHAQFGMCREGRTERFTASDDLMSHVAMLVEHYGPPTITSYVDGAT